MNKIIGVTTAVLIFFVSSGLSLAAPWTPAGNQITPNDKFVAYYPDGRKAIAGLGDQYYGRDLVMRRGNSGDFQQWFEGNDPNGNFVAIHSVWNLLKKGDSCPNDWIKIVNANPAGPDYGWGDYLVEGADYCVHNNYYQGTK